MQAPSHLLGENALLSIRFRIATTWIITRILTHSLNLSIWVPLQFWYPRISFLVPMSTLIIIILLHLPIYHTNTGQKPNGILRSINPVSSLKTLSKPAHWISIIVSIWCRNCRNHTKIKQEWQTRVVDGGVVSIGEVWNFESLKTSKSGIQF